MAFDWVEDRLSEKGENARHSGREIQVNCPACQDSGMHLYFNLDKGAWICFRCNEKGSLSSFLKLFGLSPTIAPPRKFKQEKPAPPPNPWPESIKISTSCRAYEYLTKGRSLGGKRSCLTDMDIFRWDLKVGKEWPWDNYIFWPVIDQESKLRSVHLRRFQLEGPRALMQPSGVDKTLLGADQVSFHPCDAVAIVEGPYDAAHVTRELMPHGILGMALMGHSITPLQLLQLKNIGLPVLVMLDADAWEAAQELARSINRWVPAYPVNIPTGDPDEHSGASLLQMVAKAITPKKR
jgi:hypothetical protein